ncbi:MAG TPA: hypothetical protein VK283_07425 [Acidimicrobiales bacterium]|nr:hypothetical protein [Acidimicrobiales bacterium]
MTENDAFRRYLEAGSTFTQVTRARAHELVQELIKTGELEHHKAQEWVGGLVKENRRRSGTIISTVSGEVRKQLRGLGFAKHDDLAQTAPAQTASSREPATAKTMAKKRSGATVSSPGSA